MFLLFSKLGHGLFGSDHGVQVAVPGRRRMGEDILIYPLDGIPDFRTGRRGIKPMFCIVIRIVSPWAETGATPNDRARQRKKRRFGDMGRSCYNGLRLKTVLLERRSDVFRVLFVALEYF